MPLFYNTNSPTPTTSNSINNVSISIRDFLLSKNISSTYPSISTAVNGSPRVGQPVLDTESNHLNFYPHQQLDLNTTGLDILGSVLNGQGVGIGAGGTTVPNFDVRSSLAGRVLGATGLLNDTKIGTIGAQQLALALANNASFNVQQQLLGALNVQDNVLALIGGKPLPGFRPSYQITVPSGTVGRIADFAGKMLGFTIPRSYLGSEGSIFQDENGDAENIKRANSMIENTGKGQVLALLANAKANLAVNSTLTPFRSGYAPGFTNNKGVLQLSDAKLYAFSNDNKNFENILAISDGAIPDLSYLKEEKIKSAGFLGPEELGVSPNPKGGFDGYDNRVVSSIPFSWTTSSGGMVNSVEYPDEIVGDKKSLLSKTQKLFNSVGMKNIVSVKGDMNKKSTQISQANGKGFSKGNAVLKRELFTNGIYNGAENLTADETYCRSWTTLNRYDRVSRLVRSGADSITDGIDETEVANKNINGLYDKNQVPYRDTPGQSVGSVLDAYGFPKITPYTKDKETDLKQYMFSIENLAWASSDIKAVLPSFEIGDGDLINNKKGRIMWFPPYDINFSEGNNVSWESTNFIGRGEPVYTYNNTERSGNLSFKILVDHPSYANSFRGDKGPDDHYVNSFWAGCIPPEFKNRLTESEKSWEETLTHTIPVKTTIETEPAPNVKLTVYFPNDQAAVPPYDYESGMSGTSSTDYIDYSVNSDGRGYGIDLYPAEYTEGIHKRTGWFDNTNYGLNGTSIYQPKIIFNGNEYEGWNDRAGLLIDINTYLTEKCPHCMVDVTGYASQQGVTPSNDKLVKDRALNIIEELKVWLFPDMPKPEKDKRFKFIQGKIETGNSACKPKDVYAIDKKPCKLDRRAEITFRFEQELVAEKFKKPDIIVEDGTRKYNKKITDRFYNETLYFDQLTDVDPLVFDSFRQKIKYFHPAFHSTTPEGLNARLTFLLQCTRQGPTLEAQGANNLAFGRPPVCILRIGDFYNTKIVMDSVNIDYEPLVWDLNPEGIGVQPMIANVNISFKFLGGSSLMGPINKLQNALSFNYFANTQVYDARADYISKDRPTWNLKDNDGKDLPTTMTAKESASGYYLNHGKLSSNNKKEEITFTDTPFAPPSIDEVLTQDNAAGDAQIAPADLTTPAGTIDDKAVISKIGLVGFTAYNFDDAKLNLYLVWNSSSKVTSINLNPDPPKTYKGQVYVTSSDNIKTNIGYISIRSNGANQGAVLSNSSEDEFTIGSDTKEAFWNSPLELDDAQNAAVKVAYEKNGSSLRIEWETGSINNAGFAESSAITF
jgi:hypothetical protein